MTPTHDYLNALPTKEDCSEAGPACHIVHQEVDTVKKSPKIFQAKPSFSRFPRGGIFSHSMYDLRSCHLRLTLGLPLYAYTYVIRTERRARSGHPIQYLTNMSHGQNLSSTSGEPVFVVQ
jgi:hypothetical protein